MNWCKKRITNKELQVRFADGKHRFYLESVCGDPVVTGNLCKYCYSLLAQTKTQDVRTFPHGLVNGKYTDESHIYDSPWYHKKAEAYGPPSSEVIEIAMEAQKKARAGIRIKTLKDVFTQIASTEEKETPNSNENSAEKVPVAENKKRVSKPKKTENTTENKTAEETVTLKHIQVVEVIPKMTEFVESMNDTVVIDKVVKVYLKPFTVGSTKYYRDAEREKLYSITPQQKVGKYVGRWDSEEKRIIKDAPDSDED